VDLSNLICGFPHLIYFLKESTQVILQTKVDLTLGKIEELNRLKQ